MMDIRLTTLSNLLGLIGTWEGEGKTYTSCAESCDFEEKLTFEPINDVSVMKYVQKCVLKEGQKPLNMEFGFLYIQEDGTIKVNNAGDLGRVEVLKGNLFLRNDNFCAEFVSVKHKNDEAMVRSTRELYYNEKVLTYKLFIQTTDSSLYKCKEAILRRVH